MPTIAELERVSPPRPAAFRRAVFDAWKWGYSGADAMETFRVYSCWAQQPTRAKGEASAADG
jgi:hypothetical protein